MADRGGQDAASGTLTTLSAVRIKNESDYRSIFNIIHLRQPMENPDHVVWINLID